MSENESYDEKRNLKEIMEMVKEKQAKKLAELKRLKEQGGVEFENLVYPPQRVAFLSKDNADKSIASVIYTYSDLNSVKLREVYGKVASLYKNADQFKNLIYYHYYFRFNNPLKYHEQFFNQLSPELRQTISRDGKLDDLLKLERHVYEGYTGYTLPSIHEEFIKSLNDKNVYLRRQAIPAHVKVKIEDEDKVEEQYEEHVNDIIKAITIRKNKNLLTEDLVLKFLNDYKSTKKTYDVFLENLNKEYSNLHEFVLDMGKLSKGEKKQVKKPEKKAPPLTVEQFLVRLYIRNPSIKVEQLLNEAKTALPKALFKKDKIPNMWYSTGEDEVLKNIEFVIDDYIRDNKGKVTESNLFAFLSEKLKKPESELKDVKALIKRKLNKTGERELKTVKMEGEEKQDEEEEDILPEDFMSEEEEEEGGGEGEGEERDEKEEIGEEVYNVFENVDEEREYEPEQFNRKKHINFQDSQIYGSKITGLLKTIKIENDKIKIRRKDKKISQDEPYRTLSQLDNDYQTGMWIDNYQQTWIIPMIEGDVSKYIASSITLEYKKKIWYRPTKLWFILQCNSLSYKRTLNKKNELTCFYYDINNIEKQVEFKVLYEKKNDKFVELNGDIFKEEELWKKSRTKPRELVDYYKNKSLDSEDYGVRKIAVNQLGNVLLTSSKNMMINENSQSTAVEIERRIFSDNKGGTLDQYFTDVSKIIVFLDPDRLGNYALKFRYKVHSGEINPSSINGKLSREFLLSEIFETDIPAKYEISQVIDRTVSEQRTSMFYDLISSVYNLNISIASNALNINIVVSCTNETSKMYDDSEVLHYVDDGKLYCFSVYEMSDKIKNNDLVNQYTKKPFRYQFVNYAASLVGKSVIHKEEGKEDFKFDLIKEIDDVLDDIEDMCICGEINNEKSIKSVVNKPNGNFKEKIFCSVDCMNKYDFREE